MKRNTITIQINYNNLILYHKGEYKNYPLSSITNYKINDHIIFIEEMKEILNKNKINSKLLTDNINIIIENNYTQDDESKLIDILKELSFNNIKIIKSKYILNIKENDVIININDNNIKLHYNHNILDINIYFNKHLEILSIFIKELIENYKVKNIKVYGTYENIIKMVKKLERKVRKEVYIYTHPELVPICYYIEKLNKR